MDRRKLLNVDRQNDQATSYNGNSWSIIRVLYTLKWTSCLIGLATGCVITVVMTLSLMLIIAPYLQFHNALIPSTGNNVWSSYGDWKWQPCSVTCGHGTQNGDRSRTCLSETLCVGNETEIMTRPCSIGHCKVDGQWSDWIVDGPCSVTCGKGTQNRFRKCSNPYPQNGGKPCTGQRTKQTLCNEQECCPGITKPDNLQCVNGWIRNDDFNACYCFSKRHASWDNAQTYCRQQKAELSPVYSKAESDWLSRKIRTDIGKDVWIGGKNVRYEYKWILSSGYGRMNFTNWAPNEPVLYPRHKTYICVQIWQSSSYQWDDFDCGYRQPFVCKNNL
ncbi:Hypothetical predicted protein [Mytilus galloprovincialis]|uniref:C-type lectin domain-containing protein n=1 Tax=Mytilus galloprovincialis TaxID=29158 RepID=A0A8B6CCF5_MYTGA|nr:Hypothetical predicted protein [Mytilus galloprovincialis]